MENKTNNRFCHHFLWVGSQFLTVCSRHTPPGTRTSTPRAIYLLPLTGVNKDQVKTGPPKPPGGLPQVSMWHLAWRSHRWPPARIAPSLHARVHLVHQGDLLCSGEVGEGGGVAGQGFLTPPPPGARAANHPPPTKRVNKWYDLGTAPRVGTGCRLNSWSPCWARQAILRFLSIWGKTRTGGISGRQANANSCGGTVGPRYLWTSWGSCKARGAQGGG